MEAVVKSLDPNSTSSRESILETATQILGEVVKTYAREPDLPPPSIAIDYVLIGILPSISTCQVSVSQ